MGFLGGMFDWFTDPAHWSGAEGIPHLLWQHVQISVVSVVAALVVALPIGLVLGHVRRGGFVVVNLSNVGRALPAIAILLIAVLRFGIGAPPAWMRSVGIGSIPPFLALVALAIPPVLTNAYVGVAGVDREVVDAARGMGMSGVQVLRRVELPLALPLVMAGIRTTAVAVVATATLAAYVGWGGLGRYIIDGYAVQDNQKVFAGAVLVALLSVVVEAGLALLQRAVVPRAGGGAVRASGPGADEVPGADLAESA